jgi:flagellar FliJ protein
MYRFKLEALLNHRRHQEEECQKQLAEARKELAAEQNKLGRSKREKHENVLGLQKKQQNSASVSDIILYINYIQQLSKKIEDQRRCVHTANKKVKQVHNELIMIIKKRKTLEKLKDKGQRAYEQKLIQDERKLMDEIATTRHARKI